jgi:predicted nucleic acid-binding protein
MTTRVLVLDANILIRAILGRKVRDLITTHCATVDFFTADVCIFDAEKYLPILFQKRNLPSTPALDLLSNMKCILNIIEENVYKEHKIESIKRIGNRDLQDWPIIATALTFNCPIWTEDQDFFGSGVPTWTTDRIHIFLES